MTEIKVFTICDHCNKEYELPLAENNAGIFTVFSTCPFCKGNNNRWLKILIPRSQDQKIVDDLKHVSPETAKRMIAGKDKVLTVFKENTIP